MIRALGDKVPKIAESSFISQAAYILGDVVIGERCAAYPGAVVRADFGPIRIGDDVLIEDNVVLHGDPKGLDIGNSVTLGHGAVVNSRRIGNQVLIGMNATVLHESEIGGGRGHDSARRLLRGRRTGADRGQGYPVPVVVGGS